MAIEGLDSREQLAVIPAGNQDLSVCTGGSLEDGERTSGQLVRLEYTDFVFTVTV